MRKERTVAEKMHLGPAVERKTVVWGDARAGVGAASDSVGWTQEFY